MATSATLSDLADLHARLHDLSVVAARTRGRQRVLLASVPSPSEWAGPAAAAYTTHRLTLRAASLGSLADALDGVAGHLSAVVAAVAPLSLSPADAASPPSSVRALQGLLASAGASPGAADGVWSASTSAAVARVQGAAGLPATGVVDAATALAVSAAAAGGAVAIGGGPGVPRGLLPLSGSHPVVAAPPAAVAEPDPVVPANPVVPADPAPDPTSDATGDDGTGDASGDDGTGDGSGDDGSSDSSGDGSAADEPTADADPGGGDGADPAPSDNPALRELQTTLGTSPAPRAFS